MRCQAPEPHWKNKKIVSCADYLAKPNQQFSALKASQGVYMVPPKKQCLCHLPK